MEQYSSKLMTLAYLMVGFSIYGLVSFVIDVSSLIGGVL